jgi:NAD(P)-dependent dehydrogenase (short-subunit alcohol dehydrogenase family)
MDKPSPRPSSSSLATFPAGGSAVVIGASGGLGAAVADALEASGSFAEVHRASRSDALAVDVTREETIATAAERVRNDPAPLRLVFIATGFLHGDGAMPEKSLRELAPERLAQAFAVNAVGPALVLKHFAPLLARTGKSVAAVISAKVGSIGDNHLGGWYGYRASKAALNQFVRTTAIELRRSRPEAIAVALHPGTMHTALSAPFSKAGLDAREPAAAAAQLLAVIDGLTPAQSGGFFDYRGSPLPW